MERIITHLPFLPGRGYPTTAGAGDTIRHNFFIQLYIKSNTMSQAFVRESEEQWLHEVQPTLNALIVYLTRENNGIRVYEQRSFIHAKNGREVHVMSNGLSYAKDAEGKWYIEW